MIRLSLAPGVAEEVPVLHVDDFGNVTLDLHRDALSSALGNRPGTELTFRLETPRTAVTSFRRTYGEAPADEPFLLINSAGYLEIAIRGGSAQAALGLRIGMRAQLTVGL